MNHLERGARLGALLGASCLLLGVPGCAARAQSVPHGPEPSRPRLEAELGRMVRGEPADIDGDGTPETFVGEPIRRITRDPRVVMQADARGSYRILQDANEDGRVDLVVVNAKGPPSAQMELRDVNLDGCFESREISIYSLDGLTIYRATDTDEDCDGVFTRVKEWTMPATMK